MYAYLAYRSRQAVRGLGPTGCSKNLSVVARGLRAYLRRPSLAMSALYRAGSLRLR